MPVTFNHEGFAEQSGEITVYIADQHGIYSHSATEYISRGGSLAARSYLDAPPEEKAGFAIVRTAEGWDFKPDNRGTYYSTETGEKVEWRELGDIPSNLTTAAPLAEPCKWNGKKWIVDKAAQAAEIEAARAKIDAQIIAKRDECLNGGVFVQQLGKWIDNDETGRNNLVEIKADFDLNGKDNTYILICSDDSIYPLNFADFKTAWDAVKEHKQATYANALTHRAALAQAADPQAYDWRTGWAKTYKESINER